MSLRFSKELLAVATLLGTIIGAGIFSLPYVASRVGFWVALFYLLFLGGVITLVHLLYGEVVLRTKGKKRLPGYARTYLGRPGQLLVNFSTILGFYGALLAYMILGGFFLAGIFGGANFWWSLLFLIFCSLVVLAGIRTIGEVEIILSFLLLVVIGIIFSRSLPVINFVYFQSLNWEALFLPFGVTLFALTGLAAIPEIREILKDKSQLLSQVIIAGTLTAVLVCLTFTIAVLGVSGPETTLEGVLGLSQFLGRGVVLLGAIFGLLSVASSFLVLADNLKKIFWYDFKVPPFLSWLLVTALPLFVFLAGGRELIPVMSIVGAIWGGISGGAIAFIHHKAQKAGKLLPAYQIPSLPVLKWGLVLVFSLGILGEIYLIFS